MSAAKPCPRIVLTEEKRAKFSLILSIVNWICLTLSLVLLFAGAYIKLSVDPFTSLVTGYDGSSLPYLLVACGVASGLANGLGGWLAFVSGNPLKRLRYRHFLFAYTIVTAVVCVCIFAGGVMCFAHITHLSESFEGGLANAMGHYRDDGYLKTEIDLLQMNYQCCGNMAYTDWFHIPWVHEEYIDTETSHHELSPAGYVSDDTPFSCCDAKAVRPCVHHHVHDNSRHINYDYREHVTLHKIGCKELLMETFGGLLTNLGATVMAIFIFQVILCIVGRILQTSLASAATSPNPLAPSIGYVIDLGLCAGKKPETDAAEEKKSLLVAAEAGLEGAGSLGKNQVRLMSRPSVLGSSHRPSRASLAASIKDSRMSQRSATARRASSGENRRASIPPVGGGSISRRSSAGMGRRPSEEPIYQNLPFQSPHAPSLAPPMPPMPPPPPPYVPGETATEWDSEEWEDVSDGEE